MHSDPIKEFHLHLVSDATGETLTSVANAVLVQFEAAQSETHMWVMIRTKAGLEQVIGRIKERPGIVLFTLVDQDLRNLLVRRCSEIRVPCIAVLDPVFAAVAGYLGIESRGLPGRQHVMDTNYFKRIDAVHFAMSHDDGQSVSDLEQADVVLVGVSRTSKTPTCIYLANRGVRAANVPLIPDMPLPGEVEKLMKPLVVGLTTSPERLVQVRRQRLLALHESSVSAYVDIDVVRREVTEARRLFARKNWPIIDVSRRSIEETAATILRLHLDRVKGQASD